MGTALSAKFNKRAAANIVALLEISTGIKGKNALVKMERPSTFDRLSVFFNTFYLS